MDPSQIVWPVILFLVALAQIVTAWAQARRTPPLPEQLAKDYVTKDELKHEIELLRSENARQTDAINTLTKTITSEIKQQSAAVGRLQGTVEAILRSK